MSPYFGLVVLICCSQYSYGEALTCQSWGMTHTVGDVYTDGCDLCTCKVTGPKCQTGVMCNMGKRESAQVADTGVPSVGSCVYEGENHLLGETFSTGCHYCTCTEHGVRCLSLPCGRRRRQSEGQCTKNGKSYYEGETYVQNCDQCACTGSGWKCDTFWMCELGR